MRLPCDYRISIWDLFNVISFRHNQRRHCIRKLLNCIGVAVGVLATTCAFAAEGPSFVSKPLLAGLAG